MNVTVCSAFRNSVAYIDRYFSQIDALDRLLTQRGDTLTLVLGYGDSTDDTDALLFEHTSGGAIGALLVDCTHDGPVYGSIVDAQRFKQLAYVANKMLANVPDDADAVVYVESDLIWEATTIIELLNHLDWRDCVSPMIMDSPISFYDVYAYVKDGINFVKQPPYHLAVNGGIIDMDSVGSCLVMRAELARRCRFPEADVIVGFCRQVRESGAGVWCDTGLRVQHG